MAGRRPTVLIRTIFLLVAASLLLPLGVPFSRDAVSIAAAADVGPTTTATPTPTATAAAASSPVHAAATTIPSVTPSPTSNLASPAFATTTLLPTATPTATPSPTGTPTASPTRTTTPSATATSTAIRPLLTGNQPRSVSSSLTGVSAYLGGTDQSTSFNLPLVRSDSGYDTILHVANATAGAGAFTVTFRDANGNVIPAPGAQNVPLAAWASSDLDAGQLLGTAFVGTATMTSTVGMTLAVDVIDPNAGSTTDTLDSYTGVPAQAGTSYIPAGLAQLYGYDSHLSIQNTSGAAAPTNLTFLQLGGVVATATVTPPANGLAQFDAATAAPAGWVGPIEIQASQPLASAAEMTGSAYAIASAGTTGSTFYVPRFDYNPSGGWNTAIFVLNLQSVNASFTASFYNPDGTLAKTVTSATTKLPLENWILGMPSLPISQDPHLPSGFSGSAVISVVGAGPAQAMVLRGQVSGVQFSSLASYAPPSTVPTGSWAYVPALRKSVGPESTGFTVMNPQPAAQSYQITYWDQNGNIVRSDTLANLAPFAPAYYSQALDGGLPTGGEFSAQITNTSGGAPPLVAVDLYSNYAVPPPPTATPTNTAVATNTPTATITPTFTPGASPTPSNTATITPTATITNTPTATPTPLTGVAAYLSAQVGPTTFNLPMITTMNGFDTVIHLTNTANGRATAQLTFYAANGTVAKTDSVAIARTQTFDYDVLRSLGGSFDGTAVLTTTDTLLAVNVDVVNLSAHSDGLDTYAGVPTGVTSGYLLAIRNYFGFNTATRVQNTSASPASVTVTFQTSPTPVVATMSLPPFGEAELPISSVAGIPSNFVGNAQIQSDQPIVAIAKATGSGSFALAEMAQQTTNGTFYVPRFDGPGNQPWTGMLVLENTGTSSATFNLTFFNPDGSPNTTTTKNVSAGQDMVVTTLLGSLTLNGAFSGSVVITTTGNTNVEPLKGYYANFQVSALATYGAPTAPPTGTAMYLPVLRKSAGTESTAFTLENTQSTTAKYRINYFDQSGNSVTTEYAAVPGNGAAYFSQAADTALPAAFEGTAQVTNLGGGPLPVSLIEAYAGYAVPPGPTPPVTPTASPTVTPTNTASPTPTGSPQPTPTPIGPDAYEPDNNPSLAKPISLDGVPQQRTLYQLGDQDWVSFHAGPGDLVQLATGNPTCETMLYLYDQDQTTVLAMDGNGGPGFSAQLQYTFANDGIYYARVRNYVTQQGNAGWINPTTFGICAYQLSAQLLAVNQTPVPTQTPVATATPRPTRTPTPTSTPAPVNLFPSLAGAGAYVAGTDQVTRYDLPLVRTDSGYDTIIRVSNATTGATTVKFGFRDSNGNDVIPSSPRAIALAAWASYDVDVAQALGTSFDGSAVVSSSPGGVTVAVDVICPSPTLAGTATPSTAAMSCVAPAVPAGTTPTYDGYDSYAGIPDSLAQRNPANPVYVVGAKPGPVLPFDGVIDLQNTGASAANVTLTFLGTRPNLGSPIQQAETVPAHGTLAVDVSTVVGVGKGWIGAVEIQSDQPVAAVTEMSGDGTYGITPMFASLNNSTSYVPRFDASPEPGWSSVLLLQNTNVDSSAGPTTFNLTFLNPDGTVAGTMTQAVNPGPAGLVGSIVGGLPAGFTVGSVVVTNNGGNGVAIALDPYIGSGVVVEELSGFIAPSEPPSGEWSDLPGLRKAGDGSGTSYFALMNPQTTTQNYRIDYWDHTGNHVKTDSVTLASYQAAFYAPGADPAIPVGFDGSAQVTNTSGGSPPFVIGESTAGTTYGPLPLAPAVPPTATPTSTPTSTPVLTIQSDAVYPWNCAGGVEAIFGQATVNVPASAVSRSPCDGSDGVHIQAGTVATSSGSRIGVAEELLYVNWTVALVNTNGGGLPAGEQWSSSSPVELSVDYTPWLAQLAAEGVPEQNLRFYQTGGTLSGAPLPTAVDLVHHVARVTVPANMTLALGAARTLMVLPQIYQQSAASQ